jgi:signal transduction histidine kinase/ActR/RegA family two-component response regulator
MRGRVECTPPAVLGPGRPAPPRFAVLLGVAAAYVAGGRLGLAVWPVHGLATLVWPPAGIALAAVLVGGRRLWPGIAVGALLVNLWAGAPPAVALGISAGNTLEALLAASLLRRVSGPGWSLERLPDLLALVVLGAALSTAVGATLGVGSLAAAGLVPGPELASTWRVWWLGDVLGDLVVAPLVVAWRPGLRAVAAGRRVEALGLAALVVAAGLAVFLRPPAEAAAGFVQASLFLPVLVLAALRLGLPGATAAVFLVSALAIAGTASGLGPFGQGPIPSGLLHLQAFMAVVAVSVLVVGAVTAERAAVVHRWEEAEGTLRESEARARAATEELRAAARAKDEFLALLSHELRNPLTPIRHGLSILRRAPDGSDQARRARAVLERQTLQLTRLIDDLLDVTRISRGKIQLHRRRVELEPLVRDAVEDHRPLFAARGVALELQVTGDGRVIDADPTRVTQVVGNLLQNAVKFTDPGGHVRVHLEATAGGARIRVADDGIGIAPELLPCLFEPFTQADTSLQRPRGGLGLGLALVKGLVEMQGGRVEAHSRGLGQGAELVLQLPAVAGGPAEPPRRRADAPAARRRVLVIEDNVDAAETLKEGLELGGHEVVVVHDGEEGLARARELHPDAVLCDIGLPGLDGYEVARRLRADPSLSPLLVAVTGYALAEDRLRAREAGFDRHLGKPFELRDIEDALAGGRRDQAALGPDG